MSAADEESRSSLTVGVVVVTYNRRALLEDTLRYLDQQHYPIGRIFVIDNASTDGTKEFLTKLEMPRCETVFMEKNVGGAGGFAAGMEIAYRSGVDLVWVMDDDVQPAEDALEKLVKALHDLKALGRDPNFVTCNVFNTEGEPVNAPILDLRIQTNGNMRITALLAEGLLPAVACSFVGPLFVRQAIARHGLPIAEMFIWGDDIEYTYRMTAEREAGYVVGDAKIVHLGRATELSLAKEQDWSRAEKYFYLFRNNTYALRKYGNKQKIGAYLLANIREFFELLVHLEIRKLGILVSGLYQGIRFNPNIRMVD